MSLRDLIKRLRRDNQILLCEVNKLQNQNNSEYYGSRVITTDQEEYTLSDGIETTILTFTGEASILTLPSQVNTKGLIIILTNDSSGDLTITSPEGIWEGGMKMQSSVMGIGTTARIVNDGITYRINS